MRRRRVGYKTTTRGFIKNLLIKMQKINKHGPQEKWGKSEVPPVRTYVDEMKFYCKKLHAILPNDVI
jgi:hypothetical protein